MSREITLLSHDIEHARLLATEVARVLANQQSPLQPEWVTPAQAAVILSTSIGSLEQRRARGDGPRYAKHGERLVRYRVADLHTWMEEACHDA
jgi:hypothetical protein